MTVKELWETLSKIESNPAKKIIIMKELLHDSLPKILITLQENGLDKEVEAFLKSIENQALSKFKV